jgi:hypothetical protein
MKKIAAILLLSIFIFNLFGYRLYIDYKVNTSNQSLEMVLDNDEYSNQALISIKQPINLPYYNNSSTFSRAYGEVELRGILYTYVKSRIYNDTLEMLCIPNTSKQKLLQSKNDFTSTVFDLQKDANKKSTEKLGSFIKLFSEYEQMNGWKLEIPSINTPFKNYSLYFNNSGITHHTTVEQPPDIFT